MHVVMPRKIPKYALKNVQSPIFYLRSKNVYDKKKTVLERGE